MKLKLLVAAASLALAGFATSASAVTTCTTADVQFSSACIGITAITPTPAGSASVDDLDALAGGGWTEIGKEEENSGIDEFDIDIGSKSGFYTIFGPMAGHDYALAFKGGSGQGTNVFAAYLLAATDIATNLNVSGDLYGSFNMNAFLSIAGAPPALSNAVLFKRTSGTPPPDGYIPLPAAGWLLLGGIGGLVAMRRKKAA